LKIGISTAIPDECFSGRKEPEKERGGQRKAACEDFTSFTSIEIILKHYYYSGSAECEKRSSGAVYGKRG